MKLPQIKNPDRYVDLYVVDFGDHSGVGFTAEEVAELLESEKFKDINPVRDKALGLTACEQPVSNGIKVYRIYKAYPDGKMELKGVPSEIFQLEAGMFFYEFDKIIAQGDFKRLISSAVKTAPPARAKVHLAKYSSAEGCLTADGKFATALIFPAEYGDLFSRWLLDIDYKTAGPAEGGIEAVKRYYADAPEILDRHQLWDKQKFESMTGAELLAATKMAVAR